MLKDRHILANVKGFVQSGQALVFVKAELGTVKNKVQVHN